MDEKKQLNENESINDITNEKSVDDQSNGVKESESRLVDNRENMEETESSINSIMADDQETMEKMQSVDNQVSIDEQETTNNYEAIGNQEIPVNHKEGVGDQEPMDKQNGDGFNGTRVEKNKCNFKQMNKAKLFQMIIIVLVVVSLGANIFMFLKMNNDSNVLAGNGGKVEKLNYDVNSSTSNVISNVIDSVVGVLVYSNGAASGSGSGVVYRVNGKDAYIITNAHVVEGANNVQVVFSNQESVPAEVLGSDS